MLASPFLGGFSLSDEADRGARTRNLDSACLQTRQVGIGTVQGRTALECFIGSEGAVEARDRDIDPEPITAPQTSNLCVLRPSFHRWKRQFPIGMTGQRELSFVLTQDHTYSNGVLPQNHQGFVNCSHGPSGAQGLNQSE